MSAAQTVPVLLTEEKGLKEEQNNGNQSNYVGWVFSQKHVRQVSDSKVYEQANISPKSHTSYMFRKNHHKKPPKITKSPHKDHVIEVHNLLSTFIILQKVLRTLIFVLKWIIDFFSNTHNNKSKE